jgi:hypothetical protein
VKLLNGLESILPDIDEGWPEQKNNGGKHNQDQNYYQNHLNQTFSLIIW